GRDRAYLRRDLVDDRTWYRSPHIAEFARGLDADDVAAAVVPIGGGAEMIVSATRAWGERRFSGRERELLRLITTHARWLGRRHANPIGDRRGRLRVEGVRARLAPRLRALLELLLTGRSEKQIAAAAHVSPRTAHKYIEQIYRAFEVSSRAELMALFIPR